jgi:hypothetical protein
LKDAVPNPNEDRDAVERWFAHHTGVGENAARRMAALYCVLAEADASKQGQDKPVKGNKPTQPRTRESKQQKSDTANQVGNSNPPPPPPPPPAAPGVHINLEIHISADATADQIDLIFAAMAKHIYKRV